MKIALIVIGLIVLGGGYAAYRATTSTSSNATANSNAPAANRAANTSGTASFTGSAKDLIARGEKLECTFSYDSESADTSGTMFFADGKMRGNFLMETTGQQPVTSSIIQDGTNMYSWIDGMTTGTKVALATLEDAAASANLNVNASVDTETLDQDYNFSCDSWRPDTTVFTPPSDVTFTDFSATVQSITNQGNVNACSACDLVPDATAKEECRTQLGCS